MLLNPIPLLVGLILTPIAMTMIFLGAYEEYSHHFIDKKKPLKLAIKAVRIIPIYRSCFIPNLVLQTIFINKRSMVKNNLNR